MRQIVVVGSANLDLVARTPTLPRPGETVLGHSFATVPGGKGANQAVAVTRAGASCAFIGAVGDDGFAAPLAANLATAGVDVSRLRRVPGPSGVALIAVDEAGENAIVVAPGANASLTALTGPDQALIAAADVLVCQLEIPQSGVLAAAVAARQAGTTVILNAAPAGPLPSAITDAVDLLVVNETEAAVVAGREGPSGQLCEWLLRRVPRVVLTLGARGAVYADRDGTRIDTPAPPVTAVDTTAAGDAFIGALAVAWAEGRPMGERLRWACAAGAVCAQRPGAATALPTRDEIDALATKTDDMS